MLFELLERVFVTLKHVFGKCSLFVLSANGWKDQNMDSSFSGQRKPMIWRRHCSIGQSCCSMTSKRIDWFLESSRAWFFVCLFVCFIFVSLCWFFCFVFLLFIWRILHGSAGIRNFSSSVEKYVTSERSEQVKYFFNTRRDISYLQATWNSFLVWKVKFIVKP